MTEIAVTTNIKDAINKALDLSACDKTLREALETCSGTDSINITTLQKLLRDQLHDGNVENMQSVAKHSYKS
jgi:hypothetical protein